MKLSAYAKKLKIIICPKRVEILREQYQRDIKRFDRNIASLNVYTYVVKFAIFLYERKKKSTNKLNKRLHKLYKKHNCSMNEYRRKIATRKFERFMVWSRK